MERCLKAVEIQFRVISGIIIFYKSIIKGIMRVHMYTHTHILHDWPRRDLAESSNRVSMMYKLSDVSLLLLLTSGRAIFSDKLNLDENAKENGAKINLSKWFPIFKKYARPFR